MLFCWWEGNVSDLDRRGRCPQQSVVPNPNVEKKGEDTEEEKLKTRR